MSQACLLSCSDDPLESVHVEKEHVPWEPPREARLPDEGSMRGHQPKTPDKQTNKQVPDAFP